MLHLLSYYYSNFLIWFWNPTVWLPPGFNWNDMATNKDGIKYPIFGHLVYPIPMALGLIAIRFVIERTLLVPLGQKLGLKLKPKYLLNSNPILESHFNSTSSSKLKLNHKELESLARKCNLTTRQVERWLRRKLNSTKPSTMTKFTESGWRFICYTGNLIFGVIVLWDKPWFWDINYCWYDFPHHNIPTEIWYYYMLGSSFYWSLMFSQFFDRQRRDFWQMFIHHLTTIALLGFSWTCNFTRIGSLVLILHDSADAFLEVAKMTKYAELERICDVLFGIFTVIWIITRLGIYPAYILNSTLIEAPLIVPMFPAYYIFNSMLTILLLLHGFWTYYIVKVAFKALSTGKVDKDERSSSETISDLCTTDGGNISEENDEKKKVHNSNSISKKIS